MDINTLELLIRRVSAATALIFLSTALIGLWRGLRRPRGHATGLGDQVLRAPYYLVGSAVYFGVCVLLWQPLPVSLTVAVRIIALVLGVLLFYSGLGLWFWGRRTLGKMFNASSGFGVQLYADHRLITNGPFALVRHPMYLGVLTAAWGALLVYRTWATVFMAVGFVGLVLRAHREEQALAAEFGADWEAYCRRVPAWIPRFLTSLK